MRIVKGILYWAVSWTWGLPTTFLGAIVALVVLITGHKPKRFHYNIYFEVGNGWGGVSMGAFFFVSRNASNRLKQHEAGHSIQNLMWGILFPFVIGIPSVIRYFWHTYLIRVRGRDPHSLPYWDSVWFEAQATRLGKRYFAAKEKEEVILSPC